MNKSDMRSETMMSLKSGDHQIGRAWDSLVQSISDWAADQTEMLKTMNWVLLAAFLGAPLASFAYCDPAIMICAQAGSELNPAYAAPQYGVPQLPSVSKPYAPRNSHQNYMEKFEAERRHQELIDAIRHRPMINSYQDMRDYHCALEGDRPGHCRR